MKYALVLLLCWTSLSIAADKPAEAIPILMVWAVHVDASGTVTDLRPADERVPELYKRFDAAVRGWHFSPGKINGVPQPTDTTLWVRARLEPSADGYRARILQVNTGTRYGRMTAPVYPDNARAMHRGGAVMVLVHYDADGKVAEATPEPGGDPKANGDIERAAVDAVKHWTFQPEVVAGHGIPGVAKVPLCFSVTRTSKSPCHFVDSTSHLEIEENSLLPVDSVVKIESDVTDHTL